MPPKKLKYNEVAVLRMQTLQKNGGLCPICKEPIRLDEAALDHCHKTGHIRNTLHRDCNVLLGKIENYIGRYGKRLRDMSILDVALSNIASYIDTDYTTNDFHPTHKTKEDKQVRVWRGRMNKAKTQATKTKYKNLIANFKVNR
jgi:hypothetical protein